MFSKYSYSVPLYKALAINTSILKYFEAVGIDTNKCKEMILNNKHNAITTTYHLLNK